MNNKLLVLAILLVIGLAFLTGYKEAPDARIVSVGGKQTVYEMCSVKAVANSAVVIRIAKRAHRVAYVRLWSRLPGEGWMHLEDVWYVQPGKDTHAIHWDPSQYASADHVTHMKLWLDLYDRNYNRIAFDDTVAVTIARLAPAHDIVPTSN